MCKISKKQGEAMTTLTCIVYENITVEAGDIFDILEIRYHLSISEGGDACKNSIKRGEAMTPVMCIRIL